MVRLMMLTSSLVIKITTGNYGRKNALLVEMNHSLIHCKIVWESMQNILFVVVDGNSNKRVLLVLVWVGVLNLIFVHELLHVTLVAGI